MNDKNNFTTTEYTYTVKIDGSKHDYSIQTDSNDTPEMLKEAYQQLENDIAKHKTNLYLLPAPKLTSERNNFYAATYDAAIKASGNENLMCALTELIKMANDSGNKQVNFDANGDFSFLSSDGKHYKKQTEKNALASLRRRLLNKTCLAR